MGDYTIFSAMFKHATIGIMVVGEDGFVRFANPFSEHMFGYERDSLAGLPLENLLPKSLRSEHKKHRHSYHKKPKQRHMGAGLDLVGRRKDGTHFPVEISLGFVESNGDQLAIAYINDVTQKVRAEEKLKESKARMDEAQALANMGSFEWRANESNIIWSDELFRIFGFEPQSFEVAVEKYFDCVHPDDRAMVKTYIKNMREEKKPLDFAYRIIRPDGVIRYLKGIREVEVDEDGNFVRLYGLLQDVTDERKKSVELKIKETAISNAALPIAFAKIDGTITDVNDAFVNLWGYENKNELIGKNNAELSSTKEEISQIMEIIQREGQWSGEAKAVKKDGTTFDIFGTTKIINDEHQNPIKLMGTFMDISRLKEVEAINEGFSKIVEESLNEIYIFDAESLFFRQANRAALKNLGYTLDELKQISPNDIKPEFTKNSFLQLISPLINGEKEKLVFETTHLRKDKSIYPIEAHLQYTIIGGQPSFMAIVLDTTERKRAESYTNTILSSIASHIAVVNMDGEIVTVNKTWENFAKDNDGEHILSTGVGVNYLAVCQKSAENGDESAAKAYTGIRSVLSGAEKEFYLEYPCHSPREERWFSMRVRPLSQEKEGAVIVHLNITPKKIAELELTQSLKRFETLTRLAPIGIFLSDVDGKYLFVNKKWRELTGLSFEDALDDGWKRAIFSDDKEMVFEKWENAIAKQKEFNLEFRFKNDLTGKKREVWGISAPIFDEENNVTNYIGVLNDITEINKSRRKLKNMNVELEEKVVKRTKELAENEIKLRNALEKEKELSELKSRFVSMASHEFRTPLTSILASADLIEMYRQRGNPEKLQKHINRIKSSVNNLTSILNDFLSLEKLESGNVYCSPVEVELCDFIEEVMEEVKLLTRGEQKILYSHTGKELASIDQHLVKNILLNLLSNAIKYSPNEEDVHLITENINGQLVFKVKDQGIGIPEEDQKRMFSRFFRASNVINIKGTGLGLTIVKRYLDLMGGHISFVSTPYEGTTFKVEIPQQ